MSTPSPMTYPRLYARVRQLLAHSPYSPEQIADMTGGKVTGQTIRNWLASPPKVTNPQGQKLFAVIHALRWEVELKRTNR
jgi:hypothetical protein